jgi:hypothetical protein
LFDDPSAHCRLRPLNQLAALKLKAAGEAANPLRLPVFQLMAWGLNNGLRTTHRRTVFELERLQRQAPEAAFAYLTDNLPGGLIELERALLKLSPKAAAGLLLDTLDMRLKADPRNPYPA